MAETLAIRDLRVSFARPGGRLEAVADLGLRVAPGECAGVVGESGCGKSQAFLGVMGLIARNGRATGSVRFEGAELLGAPPAALNRVRGSRLTMIFQDPMTSLTPHVRIGVQLAEVLVAHAGASWREGEAAARRMLERVWVPEAARRLRQYPHELSGGMRQRVMIAMACLCAPALLIADEPTSALDVTVQAQIIELLRSLRREFGTAVILVSHDIGVVARLADRIHVMYAGRIVESAAAAELLRRPRHPYTAGLLECVPRLSGPRLARLPSLPGGVPLEGARVPGCAFAPRCARAQSDCRTERPQLRTLGAADVACHHPVGS